MTKKSQKNSPQDSFPLWVRYCLMFFLSAWMFILGVLVGRGTAPVHFETENIQKELAALRDAVIKRDKERLEEKTGDGFKKTDLDFYEVLKKSDGNRFHAVGSLSKSRPDKGIRRSEKVKKKSLSSKKAETRMHPSGSTRTAAVKQSKNKPEMPVLKKKFTIQVASLKDRNSADVMVIKLNKRGYPAYLVKTGIKDKGTWYRIRVGAYSTKKQAQSVVERLKAENKKPFIITN